MEKNGQERINLFVPIIIIIFIGSITIIFYYTSNRTGNTIPELAEEYREVIPELSLTEINAKVSECKLGRTIHQQDWCYLDIAKNFRIDSCAEIVNIDFKGYCTAIITKDVAKCDKIYASSIQDACYITLATITRDASICRKSLRREFCESLFG